MQYSLTNMNVFIGATNWKNKISRQAKCGNHNEFVELKFENKIENQNRNG